MSILLSILYFYMFVYTLYFFVLAIRNLRDNSFNIEKKYSKYDETKNNFAVIIYSHNHKANLEELVYELKMQDYQLANFRVYAVLDDCNDGSESLFENDKFVHVVNIQDVGTLGKTEAISLLLNKIKDDNEIDAYVFIDDIRRIEPNFLTLANVAMNKYEAVAGEVNVNRENLDIVEKIKAVYKKYQANFFKQARSICGLATMIDSGLFVVRKDVIDYLDEIKIKDVNSELEFSLELSKTDNKCVYNPNIQSYVYGQDCSFKNPNLSKRFQLLKDNLKNLKTTNFSYIEHVCSLLNPNFWMIIFSYALLIWYSYNYSFIVTCKTVVFSAIILAAVFGLSLINAKLSLKELCLLALHPLYSICHIIKNFPLVKFLLKKIGANTDKDADKLVIDVNVMTKRGDRPCKLEFISTESGLAKIRFLYKNKKYTTSSHLRMIDALQQLKSKMDDYGLTLKICSCCAKFTSQVDGSTNMLKGQCHNDYPSPLLSEPRQTQVWNSCSCFEPAAINSFIEELAREVAEQKG